MWEPIEIEKARNRAIAAHATSIHTAMKNFTGLESGNVRDIIARRVGLGSGKTYEKGKLNMNIKSIEKFMNIM